MLKGKPAGRIQIMMEYQGQVPQNNSYQGGGWGQQPNQGNWNQGWNQQ